MHVGPNQDIDKIEVVVRGEMVGHVGQHHRVLQQGEQGVHAGLTEGVVPPVAVDRRQDAAEIGHQEPPLEPERPPLHRARGHHAVTAGTSEHSIKDPTVRVVTRRVMRVAGSCSSWITIANIAIVLMYCWS